jgi:hypothetical protein
MKKILFGLIALFVVLFSSATEADVYAQTTNTPTGQFVFRVVNETPYYISCYYRDNYNYYTFSLAPYNASLWYPIYGSYVWRCE